VSCLLERLPLDESSLRGIRIHHGDGAFRMSAADTQRGQPKTLVIESDKVFDETVVHLAFESCESRILEAHSFVT
jgi:hypothetical protein